MSLPDALIWLGIGALVLVAIYGGTLMLRDMLWPTDRDDDAPEFYRAVIPEHAPTTHHDAAPNPQAAAGSDSTYRSAP